MNAIIDFLLDNPGATLSQIVDAVPEATPCEVQALVEGGDISAHSEPEFGISRFYVLPLPA